MAKTCWPGLVRLSIQSRAAVAVMGSTMLAVICTASLSFSSSRAMSAASEGFNRRRQRRLVKMWLLEFVIPRFLYPDQREGTLPAQKCLRAYAPTFYEITGVIPSDWHRRSGKPYRHENCLGACA